MHRLWSGWGKLDAVLTTSPEEGEALGAAAGTELELLLLHTVQFLSHPRLSAWLPWPESMAKARICSCSFWKVVGSILIAGDLTKCSLQQCCLGCP